MADRWNTDRWNTDDVIAADQEARSYPPMACTIGLELTHRGTGTRGRVIAFTQGARIIIEDPVGGRHEFKPYDGSFAHKGRAVSLRAGAKAEPQRRFTASGSVDARHTRATVAAASRIWVEGIHDAELIERIWGDDLRVEGIVVEPMHGADDLASLVTDFRPGPRRRLGILLDHLVTGSKEHRIGAQVAGPHVLVTGHPYVDIWEAIRPETIGIGAWPEVPRGTPWKDGVVSALGTGTAPGVFWKTCLARVESYRDVETPLITAVERLIDFVSVGPPDGNH